MASRRTAVHAAQKPEMCNLKNYLSIAPGQLFEPCRHFSVASGAAKRRPLPFMTESDADVRCATLALAKLRWHSAGAPFKRA